MAQQSNFLNSNPMFSQGSQDFYYQDLQVPGGSSAMTRDPSSQSIDSQSTWNSDWTHATASSYTDTNWVEDDDYMPDVKEESAMSYQPDPAYGRPFPSPVTEQAISLGEMSLDTYQASSAYLFPASQSGNIMSTTSYYYPDSVDDQSLANENSSSRDRNYRTQVSQPMSRTNKYSNSPSFRSPVPLPSNNQAPYGTDQLEEKHTPTSLGWPKKTDLVDKYKLVLKDKEKPFLEILKNSDISQITPAIVYLDVDALLQKDSVRCQWPGECARDDIPFTRQADCGRHMRNVHGPPEDRDKFVCTYNPCLNNRHLDEHAFSRKDHCRDHYKDYHMEDIGAARGQKEAKSEKEKHAWQKKQKAWLAARKISALHWRCAKCLTKVWVNKHGYTCSVCTSQCETDRVTARMNLPRKEQSPPTMSRGMAAGSSLQPQMQYQHQSYSQRCPANCDAEGWIFVTSPTDREWEPCPYHRPNEGQIGAKSFR
ncbi:hypothetical protein VTL71DRAFT_12918 [Oculimacula yallundae]|uniref:C2H2-type domain-containing protein n=1 Tax=Oculimacula yallundae TaxID=86028 RepID=A0ABR4CPL9_9HELO